MLARLTFHRPTSVQVPKPRLLLSISPSSRFYTTNAPKGKNTNIRDAQATAFSKKEQVYEEQYIRSHDKDLTRKLSQEMEHQHGKEAAVEYEEHESQDNTTYAAPQPTQRTETQEPENLSQAPDPLLRPTVHSGFGGDKLGDRESAFEDQYVYERDKELIKQMNNKKHK